MLELTLPALFVAGLATSPHCALMCGPLQSTQLGGRSGLPRALLLLHGGRVAGYALLGATAGGLGAQLLGTLPPARYGLGIQLLAAVTLLVAGLLHWRRSRSSCAGHARVAPRTAPSAPRLPDLNRFARGLAWAAMPCAFVYAMLLFAALSGSALHGAALLAAFGLGTVPLTGASAVLLERLRGSSRGKLHRWTGASLVALALASTAVAATHIAGPVDSFWCLAVR